MSLLNELNNQKIERSFIPVGDHKRPVIPWAQYQKKPAPRDLWSDHLEKGGRVALICGKVSGDVEVLDIDLKHDRSGTLYERLKEETPKAILDKVFIQKTISGGYHWIYSSVSLERNQVLAQNKEKEALLETRGEGGYIVVYDNKLIDAEIKELSPDERDTLFSICRRFNVVVTAERTRKKDDCFDDFNERGQSIKELIEAEGWQFNSLANDGSELYTRPGKSTKDGVSASFNEGLNLFHVWTSSTEFEANRAYNPAQVFTYLKAGGDYSQASKLLRANGYGTKKKKGGGDKNNALTINDAEDWLKNRYDIRHNEIKDLIEIRDKDRGEQQFKQVNYDSIYRELQRNDFKVTKTDVVSTLKDTEYFTKPFNPIKDFFENLEPWDGVDRLDDLFRNYVEVDGNQEHFITMVKKWFARSVKCALTPRYVNKQALVFVSQEQSLGKTTFLRWLFKALELSDYYTENPNPDDKDGELALSENMYINFDELATLSRQDINRLKSFITKDALNLRKAYAIDKVRRERVSSFIGSTNRNDFLLDANNSRWLSFYVNVIKWDKERFGMSYQEDYGEQDLRQIYAQAYAYAFLINDFNIEITSQEAQDIELSNDEFKAESITIQYVNQFFKPVTRKQFDEGQEAGDSSFKFVQVKDILEILNFNIPDNKQALDVRYLGREIAQIRGYERKKHQGVYGYFVQQIAGETIRVSRADDENTANQDKPKLTQVPF